jgi:hypothetical protein
VFFQIAKLVDYFHRRHPTALSESPAGSASVSFEPKEIQVPERLTIFLYGTLSRIRGPFCLAFNTSTVQFRSVEAPARA